MVVWSKLYFIIESTSQTLMLVGRSLNWILWGRSGTVSGSYIVGIGVFDVRGSVVRSVRSDGQSVGRSN